MSPGGSGRQGRRRACSARCGPSLCTMGGVLAAAGRRRRAPVLLAAVPDVPGNRFPGLGVGIVLPEGLSCMFPAASPPATVAPTLAPVPLAAGSCGIHLM